MVAIRVDNACLQFKVRQRGRITLKEFLVRRMFSAKKNPYIYVNALNDLKLELKDGDRLGVIGHNGAGKSTFLKMLAGIYPATSGQVTVEGRISSLLDLGVGIEPDANGWDNILYRGLLQGDTPAQIRAKRQAIAEFSELGEHLNMPVRFYSSGMQVRLMFSIATAIEPEILLLDEVLGAGDIGFQEKAMNRMLTLINRARLIVFATHDLRSMRKLCTRAIWLDHGRIQADGRPDEVAEMYENHMMARAKAA
jgi:lipopolysaccharide transport system ATP-binding protein